MIAWQLADAFKAEVYRLIRQSPGAGSDFGFRDQLRGSAASVGMNIAEGFYRFGPREFARYLTVATASLEEAALWLRDGVQRQHFTPEACEPALALVKRCRVATIRLRQSLGT